MLQMLLYMQLSTIKRAQKSIKKEEEKATLVL